MPIWPGADVGGDAVGLVEDLRCSCAAAATLIRIESGTAIVIARMMLLLREPIRSCNCDGLLRVSFTEPQDHSIYRGQRLARKGRYWRVGIGISVFSHRLVACRNAGVSPPLVSLACAFVSDPLVLRWKILALQFIDDFVRSNGQTHVFGHE